MLFLFVFLPLFVITTTLMSSTFIHITKGFTRTFSFNFESIFKLTLFFQIITSVISHFALSGLFMGSLFMSILMYLLFYALMAGLMAGVMNNKSYDDISTPKTFFVIYGSFLISNIIMYFVLGFLFALLFSMTI